MNSIIKKLDQISILLDETKLADEGARFLESITPVRSGNAKRKTSSSGKEIRAAYAYAKRLDENWSSQTRGKGLIDPTIKHLEDLIQRGAI
jgi:hypothetical protein